MKKRILYIAITLVFTANWLVAQTTDKSEYRYFSFRIGSVNNFYPNPKPNNFLLMHTPYGDFYQQPVKVLNYSYGGEFDLLYHFDAANDIFGFVTGVGIRNYGFGINYVVPEYDFRVFDQYRVTTVVIPLYVKFNSSGIYINQTYLTFGLKFNINIQAYNLQKGNWAGPYIRNLSSDEFRRENTSLYLGFNFKTIYIDLEYHIRSFINKNYRTLIDEGLVKPYENLDYQANIYISAGFHIPLTRWITMRSWPAEKIRRMLTPVR